MRQGGFVIIQLHKYFKCFTYYKLVSFYNKLSYLYKKLNTRKMKYIAVSTLFILSLWACEKSAIENPAPANEITETEETEIVEITTVSTSQQTSENTTTNSSNEHTVNQSKENIIGMWELKNSNDREHSFRLVEQFNDQYGLAFENETDMYEWNYGRCATQGVHYVPYANNYTLNESIIAFKGRWLEADQFKIIRCNDRELIIQEL